MCLVLMGALNPWRLLSQLTVNGPEETGTGAPQRTQRAQRAHRKKEDHHRATRFGVRSVTRNRAVRAPQLHSASFSANTELMRACEAHHARSSAG
jgi:hypothetical protein